jgi:hypothetical protein
LVPHVYKTPLAAKILFISFGSIFLAIGVFFLGAPIWCSFAEIIPRDPVVVFALTTVLACCGIGVGVAMVVASIKRHIDLYPEAIVVDSGLPFGYRRLERKDIAAKMITFVYVPIYVLYPKMKGQRALRVGTTGSKDDYFRQWMDGIPNADKDFLRKRFWHRAQ